jgi:hypothetical protein
MNDDWIIVWFILSVVLIIGALVWYYFKHDTPIGKKLGGTVSLIFFLIMLVVFGYGGWTSLDEKGLIPHSVDAVITAEPSWLPGESKNCIAFPDQGNVTRFVHCDKGPEHQIEIKFWGRTERTGPNVENGVRWKCVKRNEGFTCYALD